MSIFLARLFPCMQATGLSLLLSTIVVHGQAPKATSPFPLSEQRINKVIRETDKFVEQTGFEGKSADEVYDIVTTMLDNVGIGCKLRPAGKLITQEICRERVEEKAERDVKKAFPSLDLESIQAQAEEKFPLLKAGDKVAIYFMPNPARLNKVEGTYEKFDGRNFVINYKRFPKESVKFISPPNENIMDLVEPERNEKVKNEFIAAKKREFMFKKSDLRDRKRHQYMVEEIKKAIRTNETNGYVFYHHKWQSLRDVVKSEIAVRYDRWLEEKKRLELEAQKKAEEEARLKAEEEARRKAEEGDAPLFKPEDEPPMPDANEPVPEFKDFNPVPPGKLPE